MGMVMLQPMHLEYFQDVPIVQIACGEAHSIALDRWGRLFAFGWNQLGQLGVGKVSDNQQYRIHLVKNLPPIRCVYSGAIFSMSISLEGKVYTWG
jgi:alpha-tubulin suppressor-like RCC1 family protein